MKTFAELAKAENPAFEDIELALTDCIRRGTDISSQEITAIIKRAALTDDQKNSLSALAIIGFADQNKLGQTEMVEQYRQVFNALG